MIQMMVFFFIKEKNMLENNELIKGKNVNADFYIKLKYSLKINKTCAGKNWIILSPANL